MQQVSDVCGDSSDCVQLEDQQCLDVCIDSEQLDVDSSVVVNQKSSTKVSKGFSGFGKLSLGQLVDRVVVGLQQQKGSAIGESRERQLRELERRMGLPTGILRQQEDVDEEMGSEQVQQDSAEVNSASVVSFTDGLPQGKPSHQQTKHIGVDDLVQQLDALTMGNINAESGQIRLSAEFDQPDQTTQ